MFSFRSAFPTVTFFASNAGLTPIAFMPVGFLAVVVAGITLFPISVLLEGTMPLVGELPADVCGRQYSEVSL